MCIPGSCASRLKGWIAPLKRDSDYGSDAGFACLYACCYLLQTQAATPITPNPKNVNQESLVGEMSKIGVSKIQIKPPEIGADLVEMALGENLGLRPNVAKCLNATEKSQKHEVHVEVFDARWSLVRCQTCNGI